MNQPLNEFINAMSAGWKLCPRNANGSSFLGTGEYPIGCCPLAHAALGKTGFARTASAVENKNMFPFLKEQQVSGDEFTGSLYSTIICLADVYNWSTPQVLRWLRTHLND
jgi:hypothetical protein